MNQTAVDLDLLLVEPGYSQNIGADGNELTISTDVLKFFGSGNFYYADGDTTTDLALINSGSMSNSIELGGDTITDCTILRGTVTLAGTIGTMTTLRVGYVTNRESDVKLTIASGATAYTTVYQVGGIVTCASAATTWDQSAGTSTFSGSVAMTTLHLRGGRMHYTSTGTLTTAWVYGGAVLDLSGGQKTVSTLYILPGGKAIYDESLVTVSDLNDWSGGS
jgi:hypothetical protein